MPFIYDKKNNKKLIKRILRKAGLDLVRYEPQTKTSSPLPMYDDPLEALCTLQGGGGSAAFECPLNKTIRRKGLRWGSSKGWHPFVETLKEYESGMTTCYDNSILKTYYKKHQTENASNALIGFNDSPNIFQEYPSYGYRLSPWRYTTIDKIYKSVKYWTNKDNKERGQPNVTFSSGGKKFTVPSLMKKENLSTRD